MTRWERSDLSAGFAFIHEVESSLQQQFSAIDETALLNQRRVLEAFRQAEVSARHFLPSTGYGYDDEGRDKLEELFAAVFGGEAAIVRPQIVSGTHAIWLALSALLRSDDTLYAISGTPYDTLQTAIGIAGNEPGSLKNGGVIYRQSELIDGRFDADEIKRVIQKDPSVKVIHIQRSRGYSSRPALTLSEIAAITREIHAIRPDIVIFADNCYGEFLETAEPIHMGVDVIAGSLIKNPGGGLAPTGGYIVGNERLISAIADRLTSPGVGRETGSYAALYTPFYQGLFMAPHVVAQALKGAVLFGAVFRRLGFSVSPLPEEPRSDIIQSIRFENERLLTMFCETMQACAPVDSYVTPRPWDMPGYQEKVIMAAGTFVQGASIELSADAPMRPPYTAYVQGGLTYEHCKLACAETLAGGKLWKLKAAVYTTVIVSLAANATFVI